MRVLIAPCAYKGSLSAQEVANAIKAGVMEAKPEAKITVIPLADGGDGTVAALHTVLGGTINKTKVTGPLGQQVEAFWLNLNSNNITVVELASACGIAYLRGERLHPLDSHTFGLGEILLTAISNSKGQVAVAVGGSASTDGGTGALTAFGARFLDQNGQILPLGGGSLVDLCRADLSCLSARTLDRLTKGRLKVLADVTNPLLGKDGAAFVFGPQKGANREQVVLLERGLTRLADLLEIETGRYLRDTAGAGAAGGTAFGLACAFGADIVSGFKWIADAVQLESKVAQCDLVISAEGKLDHQSFSGKAIGELSKLCRKYKCALAIIPGACEPGLDWARYAIGHVVPAAPSTSTVATLTDITRAAKALVARNHG